MRSREKRRAGENGVALAKVLPMRVKRGPRPARDRSTADGAATVLARVVGVGRNAVWISCEETDDVRAASLPKREMRLHLAPGDLVEATLLDDGRALVVERQPRESVLERVGEDGRRKTMAANVDGIAILSALAAPDPHRLMIDELLAVAELNDLRACLFFTKPDLVAPLFAERFARTYGALGYEVRLLDSRAGVGLAEAEALLRDRRTLLIGQSGVGKSSLFAALGGTALVGEVSRFGQGRQTTTSARLHRFPAGFLIDSPGVGEFELWRYAPQAIARGFVEFRPFLGRCRFGDCTHRDEPACAVAAATAAGTIDAGRYASYRTMAERPQAKPGDDR